MSLRHVHLVFIVLALAVALGSGAWGIAAWLGRRDASALVVGLLALGVASVLASYAPWFLRTMRRARS